MVEKKFFAVNVLKRSMEAQEIRAPEALMEVQELQECTINETPEVQILPTGRCLTLPVISVAVVVRFPLDPRVVSPFCAVTALPARPKAVGLVEVMALTLRL